MLIPKPMLTALAAGTLLQLAMVLIGHTAPAVANMFAVGGMTISLLAGVLFAVLARPAGVGAAMTGGFVAGGVCALIGILVSYFMGDVAAPVIAFGTLGSAIAGAIGGCLASLLARSGSRA